MSEAGALLRALCWVVLAAAALILFLLWRSAEGEASGYRVQAERTAERLATSNASIGRLEEALAALNAESRARSLAYDRARLRASETLADAAERYRATEAWIASLDTVEFTQTGCDAPQEVLDALAGL